MNARPQGLAQIVPLILRTWARSISALILSWYNLVRVARSFLNAFCAFDHLSWACPSFERRVSFACVERSKRTSLRCCVVGLRENFKIRSSAALLRFSVSFVRLSTNKRRASAEEDRIRPKYFPFPAGLRRASRRMATRVRELLRLLSAAQVVRAVKVLRGPCY